MYTYITFKATRAPKIVESGLDLEEAMYRASALYDKGKICINNEPLVTGVTVMVVPDQVAIDLEKAGTLPPRFNADFQCGGY